MEEIGLFVLIPEIDRFLENADISFKFGVGGENKLNSSSRFHIQWWRIYR